MTATNLTSREQVREPVSSLDRGLQGRRESEKERVRERERELESNFSTVTRGSHRNFSPRSKAVVCFVLCIHLEVQRER